MIRELRNLQYKFNLFFQRFGKTAFRAIDTITILLSIWSIGNIVWQVGFDASAEISQWLLSANRAGITAFAFIQLLKLLNYWKSGSKLPKSEIAYAVCTCAYVCYCIFSQYPDRTWWIWLTHEYAVSLLVSLISLNELSRLSITILGRHTSPTFLFMGSFILIILIGTGLLMMPRCLNGNITFLEALFTSTSAVCVTGLNIIDVSTLFTPFGHGVLLLLIQVGGLGVMTFTCFFALQLTGKASLQNQIVIRDLVSADSMNGILTTLKRIVYVTLIIEGISAWFIYNELSSAMPEASSLRLVFYAAFHSVSAFCNAGFTIFDGGLMNTAIADCHALHIILVTTIFLGGAGFPLQSSIIDWVKYHVRRSVLHILRRPDNEVFRSRLMNVNSRLMFYTHLILLAVGMLIFLLTEYNNAQFGDNIGSRLTNALFLSATARTAGFNIVDMGSLGPLTLLVMSVLMWVGCAPLSTGGGIKVTTFAILIMNIKCTLRRNDNMEAFRREISEQSKNKAFAVVALSIAIIGISTFAMKIADPGVKITTLFFEAVSAVSTVGLSLDTTPSLSQASQVIIVLDMFIGRIGVLAFIMSFVHPAPKQYYKYPDENIMI